MKRILTVILAMVMMLSLVPLSTFSVSAVETDSQGVVYTLSDDETYYIVSGYNGTPTEVKIPAEYNGLPVKEIGTGAFSNCRGLTSISVPDSITSIGGLAFYSCESLTSISVPDSVTSIGTWAFAWCNSLTGISIPNSVTSIGDEAFLDCSSLESITVSSGNTAYKSVANCLIETATKTLIAGCKNSVIPTDGSVTSIGESVFYNCSSLTSIVIPDTVTSIGDYAFAHCENLTSIEIPDSVTSIGYEAFFYCTGLTSIEIPDSVTSIGESAFGACYSLTNVVIGDSVTSIGNMAFAECESLTDIEIPDSVTSMGSSVFTWCSDLTDIYCEAKSQPNGWSADWNGSDATVHWGSDLSDNTTDAKLGDIDNDGDVDAADYILVKRSVLKTYTLTDEQFAVANIDKDNDVDAADYVLVKRIVLGSYIAE